MQRPQRHLQLKLLGLVSLVLASLAFSGCRQRKAASKSLPALASQSWRVDVPVEVFDPAVVAVPLGATSPRPILVAIHGQGDRAEWQCGSWRGIVGSRAFVLCPRGRVSQESNTLYGLGSLEDTERELRAALGALKNRFEAYVAKGPVLIAGFGAGADYATAIARQEPSFFNRVVLLGPGPVAWSPTQSQLFGTHGGKKVLFVCPDHECRELARRGVVLTRRAGADARLSEGTNLGPFFDAAMVEAIRRDFSWLVEGDPRWTLPKP